MLTLLSCILIHTAKIAVAKAVAKKRKAQTMDHVPKPKPAAKAEPVAKVAQPKLSKLEF